jgi:hypothetical protein
MDRATIVAGDGRTAMNADTGMLVPVRCAWNAWQTVEVHLEDLQNVHWYQPQGAPRPMLHAYVDCTKTDGRIAHDCRSTPGPHRLLVCVLKRQATPPAYNALVGLAAQGADGRRPIAIT